MKKYAAILLLVCAGARAEFYTGNDLLRLCNSSSVAEQAICLGYIGGATDAATSVVVCPPATVTLGQVQAIVLKALNEMPTIRHHSADQIIAETLKRVWPCQQRNNYQPGRSL